MSGMLTESGFGIELPMRQWVLAAPKRLRHFLHRDAALLRAALRLFLGAVEPTLRAHSPGAGPRGDCQTSLANDRLQAPRMSARGVRRDKAALSSG